MDQDLEAVSRFLSAIGIGFFWLFIIVVLAVILARCSNDRKDKE